ncbi:MAG: anhydro-N-acetylmuramic acid kinase [Bacteroidetes bacterium]|nr:anhydro-N-acetylmuramic acid kinase [Bacteroidota bacterium]
MDYRAIGLYSGNPAAALDIVFASFSEKAGNWTADPHLSARYTYNTEWMSRLEDAASLTAPSYCALHTAYGTYLGELVNRFVTDNALQFKVALIASPGHIVFNDSQGQPVWAGDGAALAAATRIPVISDFYAIDRAWGGKQQTTETLAARLSLTSPEAVNNPALLAALMGVLRWRQEYNVFGADTGAVANSIGGAFWNGDEA